LCQELLQPLAEYDGANPYYEHRDLITRVRAALATPQAPPLEPRGCPLPGGCSCPTAPAIPPELIQSLVWSEAALADIGDAEREPGDDLAWAERRAAEELPRIRRALQTWRHHATTPAATCEAVDADTDDVLTLAAIIRQVDGGNRMGAAALAEAILSHRAWPALLPSPTREAGPLPQAPTDEDLDDLCAEFSFLTDDEESYDSLIEMFRAVLARWGGAAVQQVPVSERPWERPGWCDEEGRCWLRGKVERDWRLVFPLNSGVPQLRYCFDFSLPHWALSVPAADKEEGQP
jgi:hypothetical protein